MSEAIQKKEIKCLSIEELKADLKEMGEKPFRAGQSSSGCTKPLNLSMK